ncbi:hypothetical protein Fmac_025621 [Flemingia macrophylla]|uniref:Uncharacterized protein n=1 Tax=Flemingia macrophylla TaxID=520843 RepID=A0ABD1LSQ9_9FABA
MKQCPNTKDLSIWRGCDSVCRPCADVCWGSLGTASKIGKDPLSVGAFELKVASAWAGKIKRKLCTKLVFKELQAPKLLLDLEGRILVNLRNLIRLPVMKFRLTRNKWNHGLKLM